ncbi:polysaccharide deacetylase family protein [Reinekea marina]|uniref:Polysaccharide deacetylase family protein n=1 Tax=Reinekea marina TaxID=1310421 RepID=A0ABV7WR00_9GAMM|nr:polysaccharide deacetylase family protein [Reinekea marina]MDN3648150.1 polysaccharide deacetylase family protein [Reinekea marina]
MVNALKATAKFARNWVKASYGEHTKQREAPRLWVLMYHRILPKADPRFALEEPGMIVTPETFEQQIIELKKHFTLVNLNNWVKQHGANEPLPNKACAITFDDGWADNYEYALPILKKHNVPSTLFAVADKIGTPFRFWPNIISELIAIKAPELAQQALLQPAFEASQHAFSRERNAQCINQLKQHSEAEIFTALNAINWQHILETNSQRALMTWDELQECEASGFLQVESHTCTHQRLNKGLGDAALTTEIATSKETLASKLNKDIELFCFPNGDYNEQALSLVKQHYTAAVTTQNGINHVSSLKLHELTRIGIHEDASNTRLKFLARLAG